MSGGKVLLASTLRGGWIVRMTGCEKEGSDKCIESSKFLENKVSFQYRVFFFLIWGFFLKSGYETQGKLINIKSH